MKTLHFDCFAGISGDMALGALVDLGVNPDTLRRELEKLGLSGWALEFFPDERGGITGTHAVVHINGRTDHLAADEDGAHEHSHEHTHGHPHDHSHEHTHEHPHDHVHHHAHDGGEGGHHRHNSWKEIRGVIEASGISAGAKKRALDIFTRIARAEAQVHGTAADEVSFHEVGAMDSIIDIVGTAIGLDLLQPDRITCGEIELGGGMVKCAHGLLPVPAPATLILVRGLPVKTGGYNKEMTTPTGAAILAASVDEFINTGNFKEIKTGYGIGTRKMERPNLLRISLREEAPSGGAEQPWKTEELVLLETNIDDMTGEALGFLMERLFEAGALDVTLNPCVMKKSRPGTLVSVLVPPAKLDSLRRLLFELSSTIGFREIPIRRLSLRREESIRSGAFGEAREKTVFYGGKPLRSKIEFEDRARVAREGGLSLMEAERLIAGRGSSERDTGQSPAGPCAEGPAR
ncbi:MAG: nickel pincer cofactor biosynthesis protein LarC [Treponema sp.]|nr:nickel pincer cofactor biosynthesis protein LarC [Treponema sp.]